MERAVAIVGATASGKSAVALAVARRRPDVELVSIDAMQVYRGMDIGTAKPTPVERAAAPHHLIDLVDPADEFTLAAFQTAYRDARAGIAQRGHRAVLVGGTGLYLRAAVDDLDIPGQWPEIRAELEASALVDVVALHGRLAELDPAAATKMEPTNSRRIVRALEVCLGSGRPFSSFGPGLDAYPPTDTTQIGLRWPRPDLARRIEARVTQMMDAGLLDEVRGLAAAGPLSRTARQALGYKELLDHLEGRVDLAEAVATIVTRTRQFAVRQDRWFRRDPRIRWVDVTTDPLEAVPTVLEALA